MGTMIVIKKAIKISLCLFFVSSTVFAQNLADAKKAIDAEQYHKGKTMLKSLISSQPTVAENYFHLGNVYLKTGDIDSAKLIFNKGVSANPASPINHVGLGAVDLALNIPSPKAHFDKALSLTGKKDYTTHLYIGKAYTQAPKPDPVAALTYLEKAKAINSKDAEVHLALGDAYRAQMKNSEAYSAYRTAFDLNKSLYRAKVELGVINKMSKAYKESADAFNEVIALNANYGPAYRELAETYYRWAQMDEKTYADKIKQALQYYEKYMDLTDRSLDSRMRHADFLILTKDYKALEKEANEMAKIDKVNPRVLRYLAYSAYENGNYAASLQALKDFMGKVEPSRLIAKDYLYLGRAQMKDSSQVAAGIANLKKAVEMDSTNAEVMSDIGKALYQAKKYGEAAQAYEIAANNPKSKTIVYDSYYLGTSYYFDYAGKKSAKLNPSKDLLTKADSAFSYVIQRAPATETAWQFRGRIARQNDENDSKGLAVPYYEKYVEIVTVTKPEMAAKNKTGLLEAYIYLGSVAANVRKDNKKAMEYFTKALAVDPSNATAQQALKALASN